MGINDDEFIMKGFRVGVFSFFILLIFFELDASELSAGDQSRPVLDSSLEKRLVVKTSYRSKKGDTLKSLAYFLYGHETWWEKLKSDNQGLSDFEGSEALPIDTEIRYRAPKMGSTYIVQPNDWLVRIVQWKYGTSTHWKEIYEKNAEKISNPNLIHANDVLILDSDGTVRNKKSGQTLLDGVNDRKAGDLSGIEGPRHEAAQAHPVCSQLQLAEEGNPCSSTALVDRKVANIDVAQESNTGSKFIFGLLAGFIFLLLFPLLLWVSHRRAIFDGNGLDEIKTAPSPFKKGNERKQRLHKKLKTKMRESLQGFKRHSIGGSQVDKSLIHWDDGELESPSGYESLTTECKKKRQRP